LKAIAMAIPTYDLFIEPILRYLAQHSQGAPAHQVYDAAADALRLSETEKLELLPSKAQAVYKNRAGWAHDRLKRAGFSSSLRRGFWKLTDKGLDYSNSHPQALTSKEVEELAFSNLNVRLRPKENPSASAPAPASASPIELTQDNVATPDDRLERAVSELRESTADDLLDTIGQGSPEFFERLVLDLLHAMGYGASRADLQHVGRSNDGGIDGIISLDRLGLEKVFVQAKRWQSSVGREAIQAFYGALAGRRANKGVFITTSSYTPHALEFARSVEKVVLIDGNRLASLLMEFGVGVTHRVVKIPKLDSDYFEE
jgi:restriction system protein